jgi:hypothetical protein
MGRGVDGSCCKADYERSHTIGDGWYAVHSLQKDVDGDLTRIQPGLEHGCFVLCESPLVNTTSQR